MMAIRRKIHVRQTSGRGPAVHRPTSPPGCPAVNAPPEHRKASSMLRRQCGHQRFQRARSRFAVAMAGYTRAVIVSG
jgi:hypothetical protein